MTEKITMTKQFELAENEDIILDNQSFVSETLNLTEVSNLRLKNVEFTNCKFTGVSFYRNDWENIIFTSCDFSNASLDNGSLTNATFKMCKMVGVKFDNIFLHKNNFDDTTLRYGSFYECKLKQCEFTSCDFTFASVAQTSLQKTRFAESEFVETNFPQTSLKDIDFRTCVLEGILVTNDDLKGAIVSSSQASELAKLLGIIIK